MHCLKGTKILCVDDNSEALYLISLILQRHGAEVITCNSAEEAIGYLNSHKFDIICSDIDMPPGLDGYDLAHALRKMESDDPSRVVTPSVAVSGNAKNPNIKKRFADFQVYMLKPFDPKRLVDVIQRLVEADGASVRAGSLESWEAEQKV